MIAPNQSWKLPKPSVELGESNDQFILKIISEGYKLELKKKPFFLRRKARRNSERSRKKEKKF